LQGELRKIKPPSFDGENKKFEYVEAWLLEMRKYSNCITTHKMQKPELHPTTLKGRHLCGGIGLSRLRTLMRREFL
jgi:hypothetical protein